MNSKAALLFWHRNSLHFSLDIYGVSQSLAYRVGSSMRTDSYEYSYTFMGKNSYRVSYFF